MLEYEEVLLAGESKVPAIPASWVGIRILNEWQQWQEKNEVLLL